MAEETIFQLLRFVEAKIVGIQMLLKHGKGFSKAFDQQLRSSIDFSVIDSLIHEYKSSESINHIADLEDKYIKVFIDSAAIQRLAAMDELDLDFYSPIQIAAKIKEELRLITDRLRIYRKLLSEHNNLTSLKGKFKATIVDFLSAIEINGCCLFEYDTSEEYEVLKKNITRFLSGEFKSISPILNFSTKNRDERYAYYIIRFILENNGIKFSQVENVTINHKNFSSGSISQHYAKMIQQQKEGRLSAKFTAFIKSFNTEISTHLS